MQDWDPLEACDSCALAEIPYSTAACAASGNELHGASNQKEFGFLIFLPVLSLFKRVMSRIVPCKACRGIWVHGAKVCKSRVKTALIFSVMLDNLEQHSTQCLSDRSWSSSATVDFAFVTLDRQGFIKLGESKQPVMKKELLMELSFKFEGSNGGCCKR